MCFACSPFANSVFGGISRRSLLKGSAAVLGATALGAGGFSCSSVEAATETGDKLYVGGPILTLNDAQPSAEAVLVRGGKIVAVGARANLEQQAQGLFATIDLKGATLLPGFIDPHSHVAFSGLQSLGANLFSPPDGPVNDIPALQRALREWIAANEAFIRKYGVIIGFGYDDSQLHEQRHPTRHDLDEVSNTIPISVTHVSGHLGALNSVALERAGAGKGTPDPAGGVFRREADGETPNGVLEESAVGLAQGKFLAPVFVGEALAIIKAGAELYASFGYTTAQEGAASAGVAGVMKKAGELGLLPIDAVIYPQLSTAKADIAPSRQYVNHVRVGGAKFFIDGSPQGKTAFLTEPYHIPPESRPAGYRGYPTVTRQQVIDAVDLSFANNWQIITHANGDAAIDWLIEAVREATEKHGPGDRRPVLIHGQTTRLDQLPKLKETGIFPAFFPVHTFYWGDWHRDSVLGPERAAQISPTRSAQDLGLKFTTHHDAPVVFPNSIRVLSATVNRVTRSGRTLGPQERVDALTALKAMTIWAAYQHFEEDSKGTVEPGKLADFVVLDKDPTALAPSDLVAIKVIETIKEGRTVYRTTI